MKSKYFVPIYQWGDTPDSENGIQYGCTMYLDLDQLYGFETEAVGHFEVEGICPTESEFKVANKTKSGAI